MRIEDSYPSPIHGVSTLAPRARPKGYATSQVNFRSDPVNKLTRRPPSTFKEVLEQVTSSEYIQYHSYARGGYTYNFIIDQLDGTVYCYQGSKFITSLSLGSYYSQNMGMYTIGHDTYVLDRDTVVTALGNTDENFVERVAHINVTSALNYGETVQVNITKSDGTRHTVAYTVPDLGLTPDYDTADKARATKQVALELAARINAGGTYDTQLVPNPDYPSDPFADTNFQKYCNPYRDDGVGGAELNPDYDDTQSVCKPYLTDFTGVAGVTAQALGSSVAVWEDSGEWLQVEIETGQGDRSVVAINKVIESTNGLPLYAVVGTRITIRPDPTTEKGTYYLQAERIADTPTGEVLEEVVWSENRNPYEPYSFDQSTLPRVINFESFPTLYTFNMKQRQAGDDESAPFPEFLGKTINAVGYFQKRLVFVSENSVYMSETDDINNWFRQSAVSLLVTDPVGVATSALEADELLYLVPHNRDLLCVSRNAQFKISGDEAITPQSISLALTTKYECQTTVSPVSIGNSVYFPIDYGDSTGVQEYTGQQNTSQDFATPVTNHVIGYLQGKATSLVASPNLEMIAMLTDTGDANTVYVYEQYTEAGGKRSQQAWSEWRFDETERVVAMSFLENELTFIVARGSELIMRGVKMNTRVATSELEIYLDDLYPLNTNGTTATLPDGYDVTDCVAIRGTNTNYEMWPVGYTVLGSTITFDEDVGYGVVYIGRPYTSSFEPTRPFRYDDDGSVITTDKIRVGQWKLSLVDTHKLTMTKTSEFNDPVDIVFESREVGGYQLGTIDTYTGDWSFSFAEEAGLATAKFFTDSYLGCTITDISWEGQYFQSTRRMT